MRLYAPRLYFMFLLENPAADFLFPPELLLQATSDGSQQNL